MKTTIKGLILVKRKKIIESFRTCGYPETGTKKRFDLVSLESFKATPFLSEETNLLRSSPNFSKDLSG